MQARYCPSCRGEFQPEIETCPDCEVPLVGELPAAPEDERELVEVFRTADSTLFPVILSLFGASGIPCLIQGGETAGGLFPLGPAGGKHLGAAILVPASRQEEALALLEAAEDVP